MVVARETFAWRFTAFQAIEQVAAGGISTLAAATFLSQPYLLYCLLSKVSCSAATAAALKVESRK